MTRAELVEKLERMGACAPGLLWVRNTPGTLEERWGEAPLLYMDWLAVKLGLRDSYNVSLDTILHAHWDRCAKLYDSYEPQLNNLDEAQHAAVRAEYAKEREALSHAYAAGCADIIRTTISWSDVEKALTK